MIARSKFRFKGLSELVIIRATNQDVEQLAWSGASYFQGRGTGEECTPNFP